MSKYSTEDRIFLLNEIIKSNQSYVTVQRAWRKEKKCKDAPTDKSLKALYEKWMTTGSVLDNKLAMATKQKSVVTEENKNLVDEYFATNPSTSTVKACKALGISRSSLRRCLDELKLTPYKIQLVQPLENHHQEKRFEFAQEMLQLVQNGGINLDNVWFSDEAYFQLGGYVNKQNYRFWGRQRPEIYIAKPLHPKKVLVWCAISSAGIFGPIFMEETMNAARYIGLLKDHFLPFIEEKDLEKKYWFMQDGARPHRTKEVFETISEQFQHRVIGLDYPQRQGGGLEWPPFSPDLNPCDYFLWGFMKDKVYEINPKTIPELKNAVTSVIQSIKVETCAAVTQGFENRLTAIIAKEGGHFEPLYH